MPPCCANAQRHGGAMPCMAAGRGPAGAKAPTPGQHAPAAVGGSAQKVCGALLPLPPSPLGRGSAVAFCPLRVLPCRCACACCPRPLRGGPPAPAIASPASPSPGRSAAPRLVRSGAPPRCRAPPAARCRPCALASPRCAVGFLWSPLLCSGAPLRFGSARRVPPSSPPRGFGAPPAPCGSPPGASGPGASSPGAGRPVGPPFSALPRALFCARVRCPLRCAVFRWRSVPVGFSPCAPRPPPPAGGLREREARLGGAAAPPPSAAPPGVWPVPVKPCALSF